MSSKTYNVPDIGKLTVTKHHMAKRIILKIKPDKSTQITIPKLMPYKLGMQFALEKKEWIIKHLSKIETVHKNEQQYTYNSVFNTRFAAVQFKSFKGGINDSFYKNGIHYFLIPESENISSQKNQELIKTFIIEVLRNEAKKHLPQKVEYFCDKYGFKVNKVFIKNLKSRWGSCSAQNNINLNLHLMRMPEYLSDFVILHELCHTVHKNHGKDFHRLLNHLVKDENQLNKELRSYYIHL